MFMPPKEIVLAGFECTAIKDDFGLCTCVMNDIASKLYEIFKIRTTDVYVFGKLLIFDL